MNLQGYRDKYMGKQVEDRATGFKGIVTAVAEWIDGCVQVLVKPKVNKDGEMPSGTWLDFSRVSIKGKGVCVKPKIAITGGPHDDCPQAPSH